MNARALFGGTRGDVRSGVYRADGLARLIFEGLIDAALIIGRSVNLLLGDVIRVFVLQTRRVGRRVVQRVGRFLRNVLASVEIVKLNAFSNG